MAQERATITHPKRHGRGLMPNLTPRVNIVGWWRYRVGVTNISGGVSAWADSSNQNNNLVQATASARPTLLSDGTILFDGVAQYLQATFTLAQPFSLYLAFSQVSWTSNDVIVDGVTATAGMIQAASSPAITGRAGSSLTADTTIAVGVPGVAVLVGNGSSSVYQAAGGAASVTTTGNANTNGLGGITLGASRTPNAFANIAVKEVIVYNTAHDAQTRLTVLRYLARISNVGGVM